MATTTENIVFDTTINLGNSGNSIKSVKAELRQLNNELATLEPGSARFVEAAKRAGELKDTIGDVRNAVDAFNPEGKFKAFAGAVGIAANGFSALQGAMSIFGADSENLNKVIAQTQGAIALATGLNGLLGMKDAFLLLRTQIVSQVIPSLLTLRGALIATGIGALAVAVGVLYANWDKFVNLIAKYIPSLSVLNDKTAENTKLLEANTKANEDASKGFKKQIDLQIAGIEDVRQREIATIEEKQRRDKQALEKEYINASNFKQLMLALEVSQKRELNDLQDKFAKEDEAKSKEQQKTILEKKAEQYKKDFQLLIDAQKLKNDEQNKIAENITIENEKQNKEDEEKLKRDRALAAQKIQVKQEQYASEQADLTADKDAKVKIAQLEVQQKLAIYSSLSSGLDAFSALAGRNTAAGKTLAIASATISTFLSAQKAYESAFLPVPTVASPFLAVASVAAAVATGLANIQAIASVQVPGASGGGSASVSAPPIPQIPQSVGGTRLSGNNTVLTRSLDEAQKVFVTETDITKTQNKVKNIIKKATIK
jgi:hypothetical protein